MPPAPSNPSSDNPSTLATMFSRMKSQLTSTSSSSQQQEMSGSNSNGLIPGSPAGKTRSKTTQPGTPTQGGTPSKIPVHVDRTGHSSTTGGGYSVPPSPSREQGHYRGSTQQGGYITTSAAQQQQQQQQHQISGLPHHATANNPMPPPPVPNRSLHPKQDSHHAQAVTAYPSNGDDSDIHMTTVNPNMLPAGYLQSLAQAPGVAYGSTGSGVPVPSIQDQRINLQPQQQQQQQQQAGGMGRRMKEDVKMQTVLRSGATGQGQQQGQRAEDQGGPQQLALWEREILASQEVKRKVSLGCLARAI